MDGHDVMEKVATPYCRPGGRIIYGADQEVSRWLDQAIPGGFSYNEDVRAFGVLSPDTPPTMAAAVAWTNFNGINIEASFASKDPSWQGRAVLREIFEYPYVHCGVERVTTLIAASNKQSILFNVRLGFEFEARIVRAAHDGGDIIVMRMFKENCRWIGETNG